MWGGGDDFEKRLENLCSEQEKSLARGVRLFKVR